MATQNDVRRIALSLPDTVEETGRFAFSVMNKGKAKGIAWVWLERTDPKKARVPNPKVLVVPVGSQDEKAMLLAADETKFFTEPHYNGYPAVLVRLDAISKGELEALITSAWRCQAPRALVAVTDAAPAPRRVRRPAAPRARREDPPARRRRAAPR